MGHSGKKEGVCVREIGRKGGETERWAKKWGESLSVYNYLTSLVFLVGLLQYVRCKERCTISPPFSSGHKRCSRKSTYDTTDRREPL